MDNKTKWIIWVVVIIIGLAILSKFAFKIGFIALVAFVAFVFGYFVGKRYGRN